MNREQAVKTLHHLQAAAESATEVPPQEIPALLGALEQLKARLWAQLNISCVGPPDGASHDDTLLEVHEASARLGVSRDYLYRHAKALPFTVRIGRSVRFSSKGIEKYIRARQR